VQHAAWAITLAQPLDAQTRVQAGGRWGEVGHRAHGSWLSMGARPKRCASSQVAAIDKVTRTAAYGAAAANANVELAAHTWVASVCTPVGTNNSVVVSSVLTAMNTSAAAAPKPGAASGKVMRRNTVSGRLPSVRAVNGRLGCTWIRVERRLTTANGMNMMA